jgi:hypothetical protein
VTFKSSNQIGGLFNRLEASRKYLFGSVGVLGETNASIIAGVFILRGQDANVVVQAAPDWESYTYNKLDLEEPEQKSFFEAALAWDLEIDGKKWADGKNVSRAPCYFHHVDCPPMLPVQVNVLSLHSVAEKLLGWSMYLLECRCLST